jgi:hypothetical protein
MIVLCHRKKRVTDRSFDHSTRRSFNLRRNWQQGSVFAVCSPWNGLPTMIFFISHIALLEPLYVEILVKVLDYNVLNKDACKAVISRAPFFITFKTTFIFHTTHHFVTEYFIFLTLKPKWNDASSLAYQNYLRYVMNSVVHWLGVYFFPFPCTPRPPFSPPPSKPYQYSLLTLPSKFSSVWGLVL